jgi:hypothetical protein
MAKAAKPMTTRLSSRIPATKRAVKLRENDKSERTLDKTQTQ